MAPRYFSIKVSCACNQSGVWLRLRNDFVQNSQYDTVVAAGLGSEKMILQYFLYRIGIFVFFRPVFSPLQAQGQREPSAASFSSQNDHNLTRTITGELAADALLAAGNPAIDCTDSFHTQRGAGSNTPSFHGGGRSHSERVEGVTRAESGRDHHYERFIDITRVEAAR